MDDRVTTFDNPSLPDAHPRPSIEMRAQLSF
jgi:hypothetical protein